MKKRKTILTRGQESQLERTAVLRIQAAAAEIAEANKIYTEHIASVQTSERSIIESVNSGRALGLVLQNLFGGREILSDRQGRFLFDQVKAKLEFKYQEACMFVSLARSMKAPAESVAEAFSRARPVLAAQELLPAVDRPAGQAAALPLFQRWISLLTAVRQPWLKLLSDHAMTDWTERELKTFLSESEWLHVERSAAEALLKEVKP